MLKIFAPSWNTIDAYDMNASFFFLLIRSISPYWSLSHVRIFTVSHKSTDSADERESEWSHQPHLTRWALFPENWRDVPINAKLVHSYILCEAHSCLVKHLVAFDSPRIYPFDSRRQRTNTSNVEGIFRWSVWSVALSAYKEQRLASSWQMQSAGLSY